MLGDQVYLHKGIGCDQRFFFLGNIIHLMVLLSQHCVKNYKCVALSFSFKFLSSQHFRSWLRVKEKKKGDTFKGVSTFFHAELCEW